MSSQRSSGISHHSRQSSSSAFTTGRVAFSSAGRQMADGSMRSFGSPVKPTPPLFSSVNTQYTPRTTFTDSPTSIHQSPQNSPPFEIPLRNSSPTRKISPEVQKRAAAFEPASAPTSIAPAERSGESAGSRNFALFKQNSFASLREQAAKQKAVVAPSTVASEMQPSNVDRSSAGGSPLITSLPVYEVR